MKLLLRICVFLAVLLATAPQCLAQVQQDKRKEFADHIRSAQAHLAEKRPDLAIPELQAAAAINPADVATQGDLGVLLFFQGKPADAIPYLRSALELQPALAQIRGVLGLAEVRTSDLAQGMKDLEAAFHAITDTNFRVQVGLELVSMHTQVGSLEQAATVLTELRKIAPDDPEVLYAAYRTYSDLAGESMLALSIRAPESAQMHQVLAHEETREGKTNEAIAEYRKAIAIDARLPGVHFELAELLRTSQDQAIKKQAEQEYHAAIADNPQDEKSMCRLGEIDAERGDFKSSLDEFTKAAELQPNDADAKLGQAKALIELEQKDKALPILEQTVREEPTNAIAHYRLSALYRQMGRMDEAKREVEMYKKLKDTKEKLRALYKGLMVQPGEIRAGASSEQ